MKNIGFKLFAALLLAVIFTVSACSEQQGKTEQSKTVEQTEPVAVNKVKMSVDGMTCMSCVSNIKKAITSLEGVDNVEVSLEKRMAYVTYDSSKVKPEQIQKVVNDKGYTASKPIQGK